jgi:hypothetical protein
VTTPFRTGADTVARPLAPLGETGKTYFKIFAAGSRSVHRECTRLVWLVELFGASPTASAVAEVMQTGHVGAEYVEYVLRHKRGLAPQPASWLLRTRRALRARESIPYSPQLATAFPRNPAGSISPTQRSARCAMDCLHHQSTAMNPSAHPDAIIAALSMRGLLDLVDALCGHRGITRDELCGRGKSRAVAAARHELWWLMRHHPERCYSYSEIARIVCRDHATPAWSCHARQDACCSAAPLRPRWRHTRRHANRRPLGIRAANISGHGPRSERSSRWKIAATTAVTRKAQGY